MKDRHVNQAGSVIYVIYAIRFLLLFFSYSAFAVDYSWFIGEQSLGVYASPQESCTDYIASQWPGSQATIAFVSVTQYKCYPDDSDSLFTYTIRNGDSCPEDFVFNSSTGECDGPLPEGINSNKNNNVCPANGSNPIHTALGYKLQTETDYDVAGQGEPFLTFKRFYSSSVYWEESGMGSHWRHSFAMRLRLSESPEITTATLFRPAGDRYYFNLQSGGSWLGDPDISGELISLVDSESQTITGWQYRNIKDDIEVYDIDGRLINITNRLGQTTTYNYNPEGQLITVTDHFGKQLGFIYDSNGRIQIITTPDNVKLTYAYDTNNNLTSFSNEDNKTRLYHYEDGRFPHALTGITDENGNRFATWTYDDQGRAISSEHAGGVDKHTLTFNADGTTTVTNPLGKQATYHFTDILGVKKVTQVEGHPTASCAGANKAYTYDANGFMTSKTDWQGNLTTYTRDSLGLELSRTEATGTLDARTITTEWHTDHRLPLRVAEPGKITEYTYDAQGRELSRTARTQP